jgi:hypothetical protein
MYLKDISDEQSIVDKWSPIFYLHSDEKYFPCSVDWINKNSVLVDHNTSPPTYVSPVTNMDLYNISKKYNFERRVSGDIILSFGKELYPGEQPIKNVPIYGLIRSQNGKIYIIYTVMFARNGEYSILGLADAGQHPADIEQMVVELDENTGELLRVFYGAHSTWVRKWVDAKNVPMEDGKIVAYMALRGHGLYERPGTVFRLFGLSNDYVEKGIKWQPKVKLIFPRDSPKYVPAEMGWTAFYGRFGGTTEKGDASGIVGAAEKQAIPDTDASKYHPPVIFSPETSEYLFMIKDFVILLIVYFIAFGVLRLTDKFIVRGPAGSYEFKDHVITIIIFYALIQIYKKFGHFMINKYAPS